MLGSIFNTCTQKGRKYWYLFKWCSLRFNKHLMLYNRTISHFLIWEKLTTRFFKKWTSIVPQQKGQYCVMLWKITKQLSTKQWIKLFWQQFWMLVHRVNDNIDTARNSVILQCFVTSSKPLCRLWKILIASFSQMIQWGLVVLYRMVYCISNCCVI